jgi:CRP-like cAMP-binding protein
LHGASVGGRRLGGIDLHHRSRRVVTPAAKVCDADGVGTDVKRSAATEADLAYWAGLLRALAPLTDADLDAVRDGLGVVTLGPGCVFLRPGDVAERVGLIREGVLRESFAGPDGDERIRGFGAPGDFAGSLSDLLHAGPARTGVTAETHARVVCLAWSRVRGAVAARPAWAQLLARVTERLYLAKAEREYELLTMDAEARYARFRERYPGLEAHVSQRSVASYLGVSPEHLSRVRRRQREHG